MRLFIPGLILVVLCAACAKHIARPSFSKEDSDPGPIAGETESPAEGDANGEVIGEDVLSLTNEVTGTGSGLDPGIPAELTFLSSHEILFAQKNGYSIVFDLNQESWTSAAQSTEGSSYNKFYDFRKLGVMGLQRGMLSVRLKDQGLRELEIPQQWTASEPIAVGPGMLAFGDDSKLTVILVKKGSAHVIDLPYRLPDHPIIQACEANCDFWLFDGKNMKTYTRGKGWSKAIRIETPQGAGTSAKMAIIFSTESDKVDNIVVRTGNGSTFALVGKEDDTPKGGQDWQEIMPLAKSYCVPCHVGDGYDKARTWTNKKDDIVNRMGTLNDAGNAAAMPKIGSPQAKTLNDSDRARILSWLKAQKDTEGGTIDNPISEDDPAVSGKLKQLSEAHCTSCHKDQMSKISYWKKNKISAYDLVQSQKMPKNKVLTANEKKEMLDAIDGI